MVAQDQGPVEAAAHIVQAIDQLFADPAVQKLLETRVPRPALSLAAKGGPVKKLRRHGHRVIVAAGVTGNQQDRIMAIAGEPSARRSGPASGIGSSLGRGTGWLIDRLLPPQCAACGRVVSVSGRLCVPCFTALDFITPPLCRRCGLPFDFDPIGDSIGGAGDGAGDSGADRDPGLLCAACAAEPPAYGRARAALRYNDRAGLLVVRFKHYDRADLAPTLAGWMIASGQSLIADADLIVPVPLHRWRLMRRGYNQSVLLARVIARAAGKPMVPDLLRRRRNTPPQTRLGRQARKTNVVGAFAVAPRHRALLPRRRVLLVDDVLTTGATAGHSAKALIAAGAERVDVLTLARVSGDD